MLSDILKPPAAPYWSELYSQADAVKDEDSSWRAFADWSRLLARKTFRASLINQRLKNVIRPINAYGASVAKLSDAELMDDIVKLRMTLRREGLGKRSTIYAFAVIRELCSRRLGMKPYDVQVMGGWAMLHGMLTEMETGEGKTLTALLPTIVAALAGVPVHVFTVNDYLAERDAEITEPVLSAIGLSSGVIVEGLEPETRRQVYGKDVVYGTNKQIVFDYLRDRTILQNVQGDIELKMRSLCGLEGFQNKLLLRGLHYAIVDEADSILIDEARTPLILSKKSPSPEEAEVAREALRLANELQENTHYKVDQLKRIITLNEKGEAALSRNIEQLSPLLSGKKRRKEAVSQALFALHMLKKAEHYILQGDKVQIVDEYTGRVMEDRQWSRGIQQMVEIKEGLQPSDRSDTIAQITYQRFFRRYRHLCGMSGTAREIEAELWKVYRLPLAVIPPRRKNRRRISAARIFSSKKQKWQHVVDRTAERSQKGQAMLIGTRTVAASILLSEQLDRAGIAHQVLNAEQNKREGEIIAQAGQTSSVTVATNIAGRGTDIKLSENVRNAGGLVVFMTERHDAKRIDRQLIGRCARQGDPGQVEIFLSLEDDLVRMGSFTFLLPIISSAMSVFPPLAKLWASLIFHWSQREIERTNAQIRASCMKRDRKLSELMAFAGQPE